MNALRTAFVLSVIGLAIGVNSSADAGKRTDHRRPAVTTASKASRAKLRAPAAHHPPMVVFGDRVIGTDPDPFIRQQLLRDLGAVFGGDN